MEKKVITSTRQLHRTSLKNSKLKYEVKQLQLSSESVKNIGVKVTSNCKFSQPRKYAVSKEVFYQRHPDTHGQSRPWWRHSWKVWNAAYSLSQHLQAIRSSPAQSTEAERLPWVGSVINEERWGNLSDSLQSLILVHHSLLKITFLDCNMWRTCRVVWHTVI